MCNNNVFDASTANNRGNNGSIYPNKKIKVNQHSLPSFKIGGRSAFKSEEIDSTIESTNPFRH
jgi:hypothetical protein